MLQPRGVGLLASGVRVLLTGFEPFHRFDINPAQEIVRAVEARGVPGVDLVTVILPCVDGEAERTLLDTHDGCNPDAVLCLGQGFKLACPIVEQVYSNLKHYRIRDNAGNEPQHQSVVDGGPDGYLSTLPAEELVRACRAAGVPCWDGRDAGSFLCNQVAYRLMHHLAGLGRRIPAGFVHVPHLPQQITDQLAVTPSMSVETASTGVAAMISALADLGSG